MESLLPSDSLFGYLLGVIKTVTGWVVASAAQDSDSSSSGVFNYSWLGFALGTFLFFAVQALHRRRQCTVDLPPSTKLIPRGYTAAELIDCDGVKSPYILIGVKGVVYNVSFEWYGPDSPYHAFAGRESSRQLGKVVVSSDECNSDWTTLSKEHLTSLDEWAARFQTKYLAVGWFVPDADYYARARKFEP